MLKLINIGGLTLPAYNLMATVAALTACVLAIPALRKRGLSYRQAAGMLAMMCAAFLIGARLWNVAVSPANYGSSLNWYSLKMQGFSLYGGLAGAFLILLACCIKWRKELWFTLDAMTVPGGVAFCIARVGCFLNGCCTGRATSSVFGVVFPSRLAAQQEAARLLPFLNTGYAVLPTQLFELAGAAAGLPFAVLLAKRLRLRQGAFFLVYAAWFSLVRLAVLPLRVLPYPDYIEKICYPLLYAGLAAVCTAVLLQRERAAGIAGIKKEKL